MMPRRAARAGEPSFNGRPLTVTRPVASCTKPASALTISAAPEPTWPAMHRISPRRTVMEKLSTMPGSDSPSTTNAGAPRAGVSSGYISPLGRPSISSMRAARSRPASPLVVTSSPLRRTVTRSQIA